MVVNLKCPITKGERTITSLILPGKILVKHIMAGDHYPVGTVERELAILSSMTGESEIILKEMDVRDWVVVQAKTKSLLESEFKDENESKNSDNDKEKDREEYKKKES